MTRASVIALVVATTGLHTAHAFVFPDKSVVANCDSSVGQRMTFEGGMIKSLADGTCLNATCSDFSANKCYPLSFTDCSASDPSLQWEHDEKQYFRSVLHDKAACLDLSAGGVGPNVGLYKCDDLLSQQWQVRGDQIVTLTDGKRCILNGGRPPPAPMPSGPYKLDRANAADMFDGIGAISGGGATSRCLPDYPETQRNQILDLLFKPSFGASLQILKVEIGGDILTTDGSESSHMHNNHTVDLESGYEWYLMKEAKARNPDIKLYGLPWAYPGWVGANPVTGEFNSSSTPFDYPEQTCRYMLEWVKGAKSAHGLDIDYVGIWNESPSDATYVKMLRKTLDDAGFNNTRIVARDGGADICNALAKDPEYAAAVDIIGLHYPSDFDSFDACFELNKPVWASEESSSYDDLNGAGCWARVINSHYALSGITSSIMWNLLGSYYPGTSWYASSMLTANQPWSGWYGVRGPPNNPAAVDTPVVWATAHLTQFTKIGWRYLKSRAGSGELPQGGFFTTLVDGPDDGNDDFSLLVVKNSYDHAPCTRPALPPSQDGVKAENVTFILDSSMGGATSLAVWYSNFERETPVLFRQQSDIKVGSDGSFTITVEPGDFYTISTVRTARRGSFDTPVPPSQPRAPIPLADDFDTTAVSQQPWLWSQMIGAFEVQVDQANASNKVLRQMAEGISVDLWPGRANMPGTLVGMREWQDVSIAVDFRLPFPAPLSSAELGGVGPAACVGTRTDWTFDLGVVLCVGIDGSWNLTYSNPTPLHPLSPQMFITGGVVPNAPLKPGEWHSLNLTTLGKSASASYDGKPLFSSQAIRDIDTGFAAMLTNGYFQVEFDNVRVDAVGTDWDPNPTPPTGCPTPPFNATEMIGTQLYTRVCQSNGITAPDQNFYLLPTFLLQHASSLLCAEAKTAEAGSAVTLQPCDVSNPRQRWKNDYSEIHHRDVPMVLETLNLTLVGGTFSGEVVTRPADWKAADDIVQWTYFDSTGQLRNTRTPNDPRTRAVCISLCKGG